MLMVRAKRPATRPWRGWAISVMHEAGAIKECEEHSWMQEATALPGNEAALRVAIDEVIPRSLAEAGVEVFPAARGPRKSGPLRIFPCISTVRPVCTPTSPPPISRKWSMRWRPWSAAEAGYQKAPATEP